MAFEKESIKEWYDRRIVEINYIWAEQPKKREGFCEIAAYLLHEAEFEEDADYFKKKAKELRTEK